MIHLAAIVLLLFREQWLPALMVLFGVMVETALAVATMQVRKGKKCAGG